MKVTALVSSLLAAGASGATLREGRQLPAELQSEIDAQKQQLENGLAEIDWEHPPMKSVAVENPATCDNGAWLGRCRNLASDHIRYPFPGENLEASKPRLYHVLVKRLGSNSTNPVTKTVFYKRQVQGSIEYNHGPDDAYHSSEKSSSDTKTTSNEWREDNSLSSGWNAGAAYSAGISLGFFGAQTQLHAGYHSDKASSEGKSGSESALTSKSGSNFEGRNCKAGHACSTELFAWFVRYSGYCKVLPVVHCGSKFDDGKSNVDMCVTPEEEMCKSHLPFRTQHCQTDNAERPYKYVPCEIEQHIVLPGSRPLIEDHYVSYPLPRTDDHDIVEYKAGCYNLVIDYCFSPVRSEKQYWSKTKGRWENRPGAPPNITAFEHPLPVIMGLSLEGDIQGYELDTEEVYNPENSPKPYYSRWLQRWYDRPGPLPNVEVYEAQLRREQDELRAEEEAQLRREEKLRRAQARRNRRQKRPIKQYRQRTTDNRSGRHSVDNRGSAGGTFIGQQNGHYYGRGVTYIGSDRRGSGGAASSYRDARGANSHRYAHSASRGAFVNVNGGGSRGNVGQSSSEYYGGDVGSIGNTGYNRGGGGVRKDYHGYDEDRGQSQDGNPAPLDEEYGAIGVRDQDRALDDGLVRNRGTYDSGNQPSPRVFDRPKLDDGSEVEASQPRLSFVDDGRGEELMLG
ncbi:hypothetical protein XA68_12335 [Ophiocordyceps unilateralis]|uniref:Uncharacterized protein n=1 Tax=Ophiocordyceps unilateralis TaxID=268505 RepID=A0A2A9PSW7_OPHUN|nr:hypothetical protein XA68_12335 [Ophiocordyceps unilateralis]